MNLFLWGKAEYEVPHIIQPKIPDFSISTLQEENIFFHILQGENPQSETLSGSIHTNFSGSWEYIIANFSWLASHNFSQKYAEITQFWNGIWYTDTQTPGEFTLYSLTATLRIELVDTEKNTLTYVYLYPQMYARFQEKYLETIKNADALRVSTIHKIWVVTGSEAEGSIADQLLQKTSQVFQTWQEAQQTNETSVQSILSWEIPEASLSAFVEKYAALLYNSKKKSIYTKNLILYQVSELIHQKEVSSALVQDIQNNLTLLKDQDMKEYQEFIQLLEQFYVLLNFSQGEDIFTPTLGISRTLYPERQSAEIAFPLAGNILFSENKVLEEMNSDILKAYGQNFSQFSQLIWKNTQDILLEAQYFSYLIEGQLFALLKQEYSDANLSLISLFLEAYESISHMSLASADKTLRVTFLYGATELMGKIDSYLRTQLFEEERWNGNLLIISHNAPIALLSQIKLQVTQIFSLIDENSKYLNAQDSRDIYIKSQTSRIKNRLNEYFIALLTYPSYEAEYDENKQNLLEDFGESPLQEDITISETKAREYLSQFEGLSLNSAKIEVVDENYYIISGAILGQSTFDFYLYPYNQFQMKNIVLNGKNLSSVYKLGVIEQDWKEQTDLLSSDENANYDFKRFFILTFLSSGTQIPGSSIEEYISDTGVNTEDKTIIVFKRDTLLGANGDFSKIQSLLSIDYNDIKVVKSNSGEYKIYIENAILTLGNKRYDFSSEYVRNQNAYFTGIKLQEGYNLVSLIGSIPLSSFMANMKSLETTLIQVGSLMEYLSNTQISAESTYTFGSKTATIKFANWGKNYTMLVSGNSILKLSQGTKVLKSNISPDDVKVYLESIL